MGYFIYRDETEVEFRRSKRAALDRAQDLAKSYPEYEWTVHYKGRVIWNSQWKQQKEIV